MIKRRYFFNAKYAHNDDSGKYSWYYNIAVFTSFFPPTIDELLSEIKDHSLTMMLHEIGRDISRDKIEVTALTRI